MKNIFLLSVAACLLLVGCKKEELSPLPGWEDGVAGLGRFVSGKFQTGAMSTSAVNMELSWNPYGKDVKINKMEIYVHWVETWYDNITQTNKSVEHFGPTGVLAPTLTINNPVVRQGYPIVITPTLVHSLFQSATFRYDTPSEVNVFSYTPSRSVPNTRFKVGDRFFVTWVFHAADGRIFKSWSVSIGAGELSGANTSVSWSAAN